MRKPFLLAAALIAQLAAATAAMAQAPADADDAAMARDLSAVLKPFYDLLGGTSEKANVEAAVDRRSRTYAPGEALRVMVKPNFDAYITVINVGSSGKVAIIFPNHYQKNSRVKAGDTVSIPAQNAKWQISVGGPEGIDLIKVVATSKPITLPELQKLAGTSVKSPILTLGRSSDEVARDLTPQLKPEKPEAGSATSVKNVLVRIKN